MRGEIFRHLRVPVTLEEYETINERATKSGLTVAAFCREFALRGWIVQRGVMDIQRLVWEINKIGVNINQAVYLANQTKSISQSQLDEIQRQHMEVWDLLDKFVEPVNFMEDFSDGDS